MMNDKSILNKSETDWVRIDLMSDEDIDNITTSEESYNSQVNYIYIYILKDYLSDGDFDYKDEYFDLD